MILKFSRFAEDGWTYLKADIVSTRFYRIQDIVTGVKLNSDVSINSLYDMLYNPESSTILTGLRNYITKNYVSSFKSTTYHPDGNANLASSRAGYVCCVALSDAAGHNCDIHIFEASKYKIYLLNDSGETIEKII